MLNPPRNEQAERFSKIQMSQKKQDTNDNPQQKKVDVNEMKKIRSGSGPLLVLEEAIGCVTSLVPISTKRNRQEMITALKRDIECWMMNHNFDSLSNLDIDLSIVVKVTSFRMQRQDVDNIAKFVLDSLRKKTQDLFPRQRDISSR